MRKGQSKKDGQVWAERFVGAREFLFLIVGQSKGYYRLLCLDDASEDKVVRSAIDRPRAGWRRLT